MKIKEAKVWLERIPLKNPYAITNHHFDQVELVMLELQLENGIIGIGSASPAEEVVHENAGFVVSDLQHYLPQHIIGKDIANFEILIEESHTRIPFSPGSSAALDIALHDCFCKHIGKSVVDYYGRKIESLATSVTIGISDVDQTLQSAREYKSMGFSIFKLKTGMHVEEDMEKVVKLRELFGSDINIRLDANQGYSIDQLKYFLKVTKNCSIELMEQPLPKGQEKNLLGIDEKERKFFVADESLMNEQSAMEWAKEPMPFGIFNIKLMKCGGIRAAGKIAALAKSSGISLFWGCNDESICSITASIHAAYAQPHTKYLDLDGSFDLQKDLVEGGFTLKNGHLLIGQEPGLGIRWNH